jgi:hypothetical protein
MIIGGTNSTFSTIDPHDDNQIRSILTDIGIQTNIGFIYAIPCRPGN